MNKFKVFMVILVVVLLATVLYFSFASDVIGEYSNGDFDFFYRVNYMEKGNTAFYIRNGNKCFEIGNYFSNESVDEITVVKNERRSLFDVHFEILFGKYKVIYYEFYI